METLSKHIASRHRCSLDLIWASMDAHGVDLTTKMDHDIRPDSRRSGRPGTTYKVPY